MAKYVTLVSDASMEIYKGNTQSSFGTALSQPLEFPSRYQVALCEISYSQDFFNEFGSLVIANTSTNILLQGIREGDAVTETLEEMKEDIFEGWWLFGGEKVGLF